MSELIQWWPVQWGLRGLLLMLSFGGMLVVLLYLARFLNPRHIWRLITADLPQFRNVEGSAKVLGQELTLRGDLQGKQDEQLKVLDRRRQIIERQLQSNRETLEITLPALEGRHEATLSAGHADRA